MSINKADHNDDVKSPTSVSGDSCTICCENTGALIRTPCHHTFHLVCLKEVVRPQCPVCRDDIRAFLIEQGLTSTEIERRSTDAIALVPQSNQWVALNSCRHRHLVLRLDAPQPIIQVVSEEALSGVTDLARIVVDFLLLP
jgi:hypothetical protein